MTLSTLGKLRQVDLRSVWATEAGDFTPWLAEEDNLELLGDTIGIELELEAQEKAVGPFSADILCKDTATNAWVLIENQLERTDHTHLGQLLTYAAGLQAVTIVWIAMRLTEEHRAALDWLNEITDERFRFFGLEIELWQIGDSFVAPKFNVVSKPNDWSQTVARGASQLGRSELTEAKQLQLDFWTAFKARVDEQDVDFKGQKPQAQHWMNVSIGRSGFHLNAIASHWDSAEETYGGHEIRAELTIDGLNSKQHFQGLADRRVDIEGGIGRELVWHNPADARACRLYVRKSVDLNKRELWPEYITWLVDELSDFYRVLKPIVRTLEP